MAKRKRRNIDGVLLNHIKTMDSNRDTAPRTPIQQHCPVTNAKRIERDSPMCTEIWNFIFRQTGRTELQAKSLALTVIHFEYQNPVQCTGGSELSIQHPFILPHRRAPRDFFRRSCARTKFVQQPCWRQSINVSVPNLKPIPKNQIAEGLHFQAMAVRQADEPTRQKFIGKRLVTYRPQRRRQASHRVSGAGIACAWMAAPKTTH